MSEPAAGRRPRGRGRIHRRSHAEAQAAERERRSTARQASRTTCCGSGAQVDAALERAGRAVADRDAELADRVRWDDAEVNDLQRRVSNEIAVTLATQQPMARDLASCWRSTTPQPSSSGWATTR